MWELLNIHGDMKFSWENVFLACEIDVTVFGQLRNSSHNVNVSVKCAAYITKYLHILWIKKYLCSFW